MDKRGELFGDVIVYLDQAACECRVEDSVDLAEYIEDALIPFVEAERRRAALRQQR